ncbi:GP155 protein, partial [Polyodon spathula]|nr:GP155 protein [Polyodon spathula]
MNPNPSMSIDNLFPALLECFGIILCGYIAGRANIITSSQAKGLGNFVSKFALPALLFKNMVLLDFANVVWSFLWSILIAKVAVFIIVCALTLLVASPESRFGKAGLYSIFATQSNDFALGYPIVEALYKNTYPDYLQYIYLVAPVSLMILNPIGFGFCEVQKWKVNKNPQQNKVKIVGVVLLQVLKNPIVFMVIIGIASHFILGQKIPAVMEQFLDGLANSFGGSALFYLGLTMVGQLRKLTKSTFVALILLITAKLIPIFVVGILLMAGQKVVDPIDSAFFYGNDQIISTSVVLSCSILVAGVSLMGLGRSRRDANYQLLDPTSSSGTSEDLRPQNNQETQTLSDLLSPDAEVISNRECFKINISLFEGCCACESVNSEVSCSAQPMPNMIVDAHANETPAVQTAECVSHCESQICMLSQEEQLLHTTDRQLARHVLLCLLLIVGLFANLSSCLWWLFNQEPGRLYVELQFFCVIFNYAQGFISFGIFGLDKHLIIVPFKKRLAHLWRGRDKVEEPESAVPEEIIMTCRQFVSYHKDQCVKDIVQERRCGIKTAAGIFCGCDLVDWLIRVGLAHDRGEGVEYGEQLLQGGVLQHLTGEYEFRDESLYYRFIKQRSRM